LISGNHRVSEESSAAVTEPKSPGATLKDEPLEKLKRKLGFSSGGLSQEEALARLDRYGYNELVEKKGNPLFKFLTYLWGPIPVMIMVAAALSGILRQWPDLGVILLLLFMNAVVGFREEYQASNVIEALKQKLATKAIVKRDGKWLTVLARELVPGDSIRLRIGEIVPADARLLEGDPVQVDQAALTGESLPVERKAGDAVFSGSIIRQGEIEALVYATGKDTYYGKTAQLVETAKTRSHLQQAVLKIADYLIIVAIALAIVVLGVALVRGDQLLVVLHFTLVLTIAAVPVAMPAVMSITMALGARLLALKDAIVTRLPAIEEMAGIDVLCSDKTGTLTQSKLTPGRPFALDGFTKDEVTLSAALTSRAEDKDPIDLAVLSGITDKKKLEPYDVVYFHPFDPVHKRTEATVKGPGGQKFKVSKGAIQVILELDQEAERIQGRVYEAVNDFASRGFRSLGVARTDEKGRWRFMGVIPLSDPLREDSRATVDSAREMGLQIKMITGDQMAIAKEIARQLDLGSDIMDASVFDETKEYQRGQLADTVERADGFAQVFPEHKYHIVDILQQRGHIVGMTGDGVNDAPALKKADAGIAVSGSTDAARAAASIVLLVPGLSAIVDAIKESRKIFQRMNNYAIYRIAETIRVLMFLTLSILVFNFYPVTAIMIVLLAILNDAAILSIAYDNVHYSNRPESWSMRTVLGVATVLGVFGVIASFGLFYLGETYFHLSREMLQTLMYLKLSAAGQLTIYITRTRGPFWSIRPARILMLATGSAQLLATLIAVYGLFMAPIGWHWAGFIWGYVLAWFVLNDRVKLAAYRLFGREHSGLLVRQAGS
jgi:H+-transporting ATPase